VLIITNAKCSAEKQTHIRSNGATLWLAETLPAQFPKELGVVTDYMEQERILSEAFPDKYYSVDQYVCRSPCFSVPTDGHLLLCSLRSHGNLLCARRAPLHLCSRPH
jgi:hypothetical protein